MVERMKILVTGGAGFIGSAVVRRAITDGHSIVNVDALTYAANLKNVESAARSLNYSFEQADIRNRAALDGLFSRYGPDAVMHLAAESHVDRSIDDPSDFVQTNMVGTFNLLEASRKYWIDTGRPAAFRFHHVSTDEVYGSLGETGKFSEEAPCAPNSPYAASKAASDHLVRAWHKTFGLPVVISNCSNNYGPFQFPEKLVPVVILNALAGKPVPVYGTGENVRDWLYVEDHADALLAVLELGQTGRTYNIGGENEAPNIEIVHAICAILDKESPKSTPHADLIAFVSSRIRRELGWRPSLTLQQGLEKTVQWYLANENWWRPLKDRPNVGRRQGLTV
jgi:dTDP-glucose 4,6-dehydratase